MGCMWGQCVCVCAFVLYTIIINLSGRGKKSVAGNLAWTEGVGGYDTSNLNEVVMLNNNVACTCSAYKILAIKYIQEGSA